jgi:hypothetical protein
MLNNRINSIVIQYTSTSNVSSSSPHASSSSSHFPDSSSLSTSCGNLVSNENAGFGGAGNRDCRSSSSSSANSCPIFRILRDAFVSMTLSSSFSSFRLRFFGVFDLKDCVAEYSSASGLWRSFDWAGRGTLGIVRECVVVLFGGGDIFSVGIFNFFL